MGDNDINASYDDKPPQLLEASQEQLNATAPVESAREEAKKAAEDAAEEINRINAELMESTKQEVAAKEQRITELMAMVEDLEQKLRDAPEPGTPTKELASIESQKDLWQQERAEME